MSKYLPLSEHLAALAGDQWRATFAEIEAVLGVSLPKAAHQPAWWTGEGKVHQRAWLDAGWRVSDIGPGVVGFRRIVDETPAEQSAPQAEPEISPLKATGLALAAGAAVAVVAGLGVVAVKAVRNRRA